MIFHRLQVWIKWYIFIYCCSLTQAHLGCSVCWTWVRVLPVSVIFHGSEYFKCHGQQSWKQVHNFNYFFQRGFAKRSCILLGDLFIPQISFQPTFLVMLSLVFFILFFCVKEKVIKWFVEFYIVSVFTKNPWPFTRKCCNAACVHW